jgi:2-phospho-L-lactate guanylyltransferase (CobY/MobA/RfbA family)
LVRKDPGLNPSLDAAGLELAERGIRGLLVVLGDVAGALAEDLGALFDALDGLGGRGAVLAPSRDGGTSALLRAPHAVIPNRFGKNSAAAHRDLARRGGVPCSELSLPSLAIDLDRARDVEDLLRVERGADRTRALLRELGFGSGS